MILNARQQKFVQVPFPHYFFGATKKRRGDAALADVGLDHHIGAERAFYHWFILERRVEDVAASTPQYFEPADLSSTICSYYLRVFAFFFPLREDVEGPAVLPDAPDLLRS